MHLVRQRGSLVAALLIAVVAWTGCVSLSMTPQRRSRWMALETLVPPERVWTADKVLLVGIDGVLTSSAGDGGLLSEPSAVVKLRDVLDRAEKDPTIRALLVRIDSPGGSVTASDLLYNELLRYKKKTGNKVIAMCMGMTASGGYYAAMASDRVVVLPTGIVGSIGVIGLFPNLSGLTGKIGVDVRVVKSGEFKDTGSMWRPFTDAERAILQGMIDSMYERFLATVRAGRPKLDEATVRRLADGRIYTAQQAVDLGLADQVGSVDDAFAAARAAAGLKDAALVAYHRPGQYIGHYYAQTGSLSPEARAKSAPGAESGAPTAAAAAPQVHLFNLNLGTGGSIGVGRPQTEGPFYYLWMP